MRATQSGGGGGDCCHRRRPPLFYFSSPPFFSSFYVFKNVEYRLGNEKNRKEGTNEWATTTKEPSHAEGRKLLVSLSKLERLKLFWLFFFDSSESVFLQRNSWDNSVKLLPTAPRLLLVCSESAPRLLLVCSKAATALLRGCSGSKLCSGSKFRSKHPSQI